MFEKIMVMSMDSAADQAMGSPMEDSALSIRHQESADEELTMDEQSRASGQTVVDVVKNQQQQQQHQQKVSHSKQKLTQQDEQHYGTTKNETDTSAAMVLSRESSFNDENRGDERKLMMNVDYEANTSLEQKQGSSNEQTALKHRFEDRGDIDSKDPLVARMRDIVEGNQTTVTQCQHHHHHQHHHHQHQQPKSSSGDSLNNQATENNSKTSIDSAQQKRSRQTRHCGRHHHHHHHHHRPSLGTNVNVEQTTSTGHHHHHHHHHRRPGGHQHVHRHHHHHHSHDHQQQQQTDPQTSTGDIASGKRTTSQRPLGEPDVYKHQVESSFSQTEASKQTGESKSSNSSVSSVPADQHQPQQEADMSNKSNSGPLNQSSEAVNENSDLKDGLERCMHHQTCHHHHHTHQTGTAQHPPHHHHHHHHYHGRHHHHRNHKKRLVQDAGDDQPIQQADNQSIADSQQAKSDIGERSAFETPVKQQDMVAEVSPKDQMERTPLQEINPLALNLPQSSGSCCPHHEHHCASHQSRGAAIKLHPHHYHHHHHHQHLDSQAKREVSAGEQQHRSHHHHHHRHHHHGQHHNKQRARRHKSSSNTNIDEQAHREHGPDYEPPMIDNRESTKDKDQVEAGTNKEDVNAPVVTDNCDLNDPCSGKREQTDLEDTMHLDHNDYGRSSKHANQRSSMDKASSEVVSMDISPNSDNKQIKRTGLNSEAGELIDSAVTDSNFIASIEISKSTELGAIEKALSNSKDEHNYQQQVKDSDFNAQGVSGSDGTKNNSVHEFTRNQEGDSIKQARGKDQVVGQMSRENSRKEMVSGTGAGASKQQHNQQSIECSPVQQNTYQQSSQPKQIVESTVSSDRRCRLCWCCCCPCSGLSSRNNPSKAETKTNVVEAPSSTANKCQAIPNIPLDKIRSWSESFDRLMKCPDGRRVFQDFLRCEYSEENILFWIACEELKHEKDAKSIAIKARDIYEDYISILSAKEVSLDSRVRDIINNNIKKPTSNIFDEAQLQIYTLMHRDSYPRFINSPMYKKLAQIQTSSSRKGST